eukprot:jgi/Mesen1/7752/ME000407S06972
MTSQHSSVRIVVIGDQGTGKSSLITSVATESFPERAPPVLPPTRLPPQPESSVPLMLIDTSSRKEDFASVEAEIKRADAIVVTYSCADASTLQSLSTTWMPLVRRLAVEVPVVVVGCKLEVRAEAHPSLEAIMAPIMHEYREIETCLECSARTRMQVDDVFYYAKSAVLHPTAPLFDHALQSLRPKAVSAFRRIFTLCDADKDGALSDAELSAFQVYCFSAPLQPSELAGVKRVVADKVSEGVCERGLTLTGFLYLHALFIERGRLETTWTVLRVFGYSDALDLRPDYVNAPPSLAAAAPDQSVELNASGLDYLTGVFRAYDSDKDGILTAAEVDEVFSTAPSRPWQEAPYASAAEATAQGGLTLNAFISLWSLMVLLEPHKALVHLICLGLRPEEAASSLIVTRRRQADRKKKHQSARQVLQCYVFGPPKAGKSALLDALTGRPFETNYVPTAQLRYGANVIAAPDADEAEEVGASLPLLLPAGVQGLGLAAAASASVASFNRGVGMGVVAVEVEVEVQEARDRKQKKVLVLHEVPEAHVAALLSSPAQLGRCDVMLFAYDSSSEESWLRAKELLESVAAAAHGARCECPALLVAAKDDLEPDDGSSIADAAKVCADMGLEPAVPVSVRMGDTGELWHRLIGAALRPHLHIPEAATQRSNRQTRELVRQSLIITTVGTAVVVGAIIGYRIYLARRTSQ